MTMSKNMVDKLLDCEKHCKAVKSYAGVFFSKEEDKFIVVARGYRAVVHYIRQCLCEIYKCVGDNAISRIAIRKGKNGQYKVVKDGEILGEFEDLVNIIDRLIAKKFAGKREIYIDGDRTINKEIEL